MLSINYFEGCTEGREYAYRLSEWCFNNKANIYDGFEKSIWVYISKYISAPKIPESINELMNIIFQDLDDYESYSFASMLQDRSFLIYFISKFNENLIIKT